MPRATLTAPTGFDLEAELDRQRRLLLDSGAAADAELGAADVAAALERRLSDAAEVDADGSTYGAGILRSPDGWLVHEGRWAGAHTVFAVHGNQQGAVAITCLDEDLEPQEVGLTFRHLWFPA